MNRDGSKISLWQSGMPAYNDYNRNLPADTMDVAIIGGGITGLATAYNLQKNGKNCVLIESHSLGFGTTGGTTAHLNSLLDTSYDRIEKKFGEDASRLVFQAADEAIHAIEKNARELNIQCGFEYKSAWLFSKDKKQSDELEDIVKASAKAGLKISYSDSNIVPAPFDKVAIIADQAQFHPAEYIYGLAKAFEEAGGIILQQCRMESFEDDSVISIKTSRGIMRSRYIVFATHIPPGVNLLHFRCAPYRSYAIAVQLENDGYPDGLAYDMDKFYHYYRTQVINGEKYLIFGGEDHKTGHDPQAANHFKRLEIYLRHEFDIRSVNYQWSSQYFESSDGLAYIGHLPGHTSNVYVATGFSGNGMTYSHIAARLISDMILTGQSIYWELFDPKRIKPVAGFTHFVRENADVVKEFIAKRISVDKIKTLSEVKNGEAKVIKYDGESIALYRNEQGILHTVNPVCTHAKCIVQWNDAENSWDCPCHGARYNPDGEILTGPATMKLEKRELNEQ